MGGIHVSCTKSSSKHVDDLLMAIYKELSLPWIEAEESVGFYLKLMRKNQGEIVK